MGNPSVVVLDSGALSRLAERSSSAVATIRQFRQESWPFVVPTMVLIECLQGHAGRDATINRFLKTCLIVDRVPEETARRAASLRSAARRGSAVDALVTALAEPGGVVLTEDEADIRALAAKAEGIVVRRV